MASDKPTPNDQRADVKNPNNPAHQADLDNRANQKNPNQNPQQENPQQPAKK